MDAGTWTIGARHRLARWRATIDGVGVEFDADIARTQIPEIHAHETPESGGPCFRARGRASTHENTTGYGRILWRSGPMRDRTWTRILFVRR